MFKHGCTWGCCVAALLQRAACCFTLEVADACNRAPLLRWLRGISVCVLRHCCRHLCCTDVKQVSFELSKSRLTSPRLSSLLTEMLPSGSMSFSCGLDPYIPSCLDISPCLVASVVCCLHVAMPLLSTGCQRSCMWLFTGCQYCLLFAGIVCGLRSLSAGCHLCLLVVQLCILHSAVHWLSVLSVACRYNLRSAVLICWLPLVSTGGSASHFLFISYFSTWCGQGS